jgi:hypothetical protein
MHNQDHWHARPALGVAVAALARAGPGSGPGRTRGPGACRRQPVASESERPAGGHGLGASVLRPLSLTQAQYPGVLLVP